MSNDIFEKMADEIDSLENEIERLNCALIISRGKHENAIAEIERLQAVVDAVTKVTDRAAHDRSYDGNLIEDIRAALEDDDA